MSNSFDEYEPGERRGFARLLAEAMRPHLQEAMQEAIAEYMGQNGEQHRADHAEIAEVRRVRLKLEEAERERQKNKDQDDRQFRRQVKGGIVLIVITLIANFAMRFFGY